MSEDTQVPVQYQLPFSGREVTVQKAAEYLRCSDQKVRTLIEEGSIEGAYRLSKRGWWKIPFDSLVDFINRIRKNDHGHAD